MEWNVSVLSLGCRLYVNSRLWDFFQIPSSQNLFFVLWQKLTLSTGHVFICLPFTCLIFMGLKRDRNAEEPYKLKHAGGRNTETDRGSTLVWLIQFELCCAQETCHKKTVSLYQERQERVTRRARPTVKLTREKFIPGHRVWPEGDLSVPKAFHHTNDANFELKLLRVQKDTSPSTHIRPWWNTVWIDHFISAADRK